MAKLNFRIKGQELILLNRETIIVADSRNYLYAQFGFSEEWDEENKTAVFVQGEAVYNVLLVEDRCLVPHEVIKSPGFTVSVYGGDLITANKVTVPVIESGMIEGEAPPEPTPDIYNQLVETVASEKEAAQAAKNAASESASSAAASASGAAEAAGSAETSAQNAATSAAEAKKSQEAAAGSETNAKASETTAVQAMEDLLAMLGTDIATLVGGKIPMEQIPSIATTEIYHAANQAEMETLSASVQRGDICIRTDEDKSYIYDGGWVYLASPTDYAERAGYAETAKTAEDAVKINGHRVVVFATRSEYEAAAKDPNTLYLVGDVE